MAVHYGNGGWVMLDGDEVEMPGPVYLRLSEVDGSTRVTELYIDGRGQAISARALRAFPLPALQQWIEGARPLRMRQEVVGVDLSRLASHYATGFGTGAGANHWVADSFRSQIPGSGVTPAPMGRTPSRGTHLAEPTLEAPEEGLTDDFLRKVAAAYDAAVAHGRSPGKALAELAGVSDRTVHRWVYTARQRGLMPPARGRGRVV